MTQIKNLVFEAWLKLKLINLKSLSFTEYNITVKLEIFIQISNKKRFYLFLKEYLSPTNDGGNQLLIS
jgi:hypothetical protein